MQRGNTRLANYGLGWNTALLVTPACEINRLKSGRNGREKGQMVTSIHRLGMLLIIGLALAPAGVAYAQSTGGVPGQIIYGPLDLAMPNAVPMEGGAFDEAAGYGRGIDLSLGSSDVMRSDGPIFAGQTPSVVPRPASPLQDGAGHAVAIREIGRIAEEVGAVDLSQRIGVMTMAPLVWGRELSAGQPKHERGLTGVDVGLAF